MKLILLVSITLSFCVIMGVEKQLHINANVVVDFLLFLLL